MKGRHSDGWIWSSRGRWFVFLIVRSGVVAGSAGAASVTKIRAQPQQLTLVCVVGALVMMPGTSLSSHPAANPLSAASTPDVVCEGSLGLTPVVDIGSTVAPVPAATVVAKAPGRVYVTHMRDGSKIRVYDLAGEHVATIGGSAGEPGEYAYIRALDIDTAGLLHIFDAGNLRHTILDASGRVIRRSPMPGRVEENGAIVVDEAHYLMNGATLGRRGPPVHLVDSTGSVVRSFRQVEDHPTGRSEFIYGVAISVDRSHFWVAPHSRYRLDLWDWEGNLVRSIERAPDWWVEDRPPTPRTLPADEATQPPTNSSALVAVAQREPGSVLVAGRTPRSEWEAVMEGGRALDMNAVAEPFLERIDSERGRALGTCFFDFAWGGLVDSDHFFAYREERAGAGWIRIWSIDPVP